MREHWNCFSYRNLSPPPRSHWAHLMTPALSFNRCAPPSQTLNQIVSSAQIDLPMMRGLNARKWVSWGPPPLHQISKKTIIIRISQIPKLFLFKLTVPKFPWANEILRISLKISPKWSKLHQNLSTENFATKFFHRNFLHLT